MRYLIAGAGPAGVIAAETIRAQDADGEIIILGEEDEVPYSRMAIPYLLTGKVDETGTHLRKEASHYQSLNIEVRQGVRLEKIDSSGKSVTLDNGESLTYDKLLLATGSRPNRPPIPGIEAEGILPCWTLEQARQIKATVTPETHIVLIGAGFIGSIILDSLSNTQLTVVEAGDRMVPRMMDKTGAEVIKKWCESKGVTIHTSTLVERIEPGKERKFSAALSNGQNVEADLIITAAGVTPNSECVEGSGIATDQGILVDEHLQTNIPDIYAVGDVAQGTDFSSKENTAVVAIQPVAAEHAQVCGRNMTGTPTSYRGALAMNVVDTIGLTYYTFGAWMGVEGGEHAEGQDEERFKYTKLEFEGDLLVGAIIVGHFEHVGALRGLIQNSIPLGDWKAKLLENPDTLMEAYLSVTGRGLNVPRLHLGQ